MTNEPNTTGRVTPMFKWMLLPQVAFFVLFQWTMLYCGFHAGNQVPADIPFIFYPVVGYHMINGIGGGFVELMRNRTRPWYISHWVGGMAGMIIGLPALYFGVRGPILK